MTGYIYNFEGHGKFAPDGRVPDHIDAEAHNKALERAELERWAARPDAFGGYITKCQPRCAIAGDGADRATKVLTTWLGTELGRVVRSSTFTNNLGARIRAVTVRGNNGATYYGRYGYDWSQFVRLRKMK